MYKVLNIEGKDYKIEFSVEAALYDDCVVDTSNLLMGSSLAADKDDMKSFITTMANIPRTALTIFYAGLMEHHGAAGDGTVVDKDTAKKLLSIYLKGHKGEDTGSFYGLMELLLEQMGEDGFFEQIGLDRMMKAGEKDQTKKTPQDHKTPGKRKVSVK